MKVVIFAVEYIYDKINLYDINIIMYGGNIVKMCAY